MNIDQLKGQWKQLEGNVQKQWGKLTQDDLDQIAGERKILVGKLQNSYGKTREAAEQEVDEFLKTLQ